MIKVRSVEMRGEDKINLWDILFVLMGGPPGSTISSSSAASDVYRGQVMTCLLLVIVSCYGGLRVVSLPLTHISQPTRPH